jgi:hypothetical protein
LDCGGAGGAEPGALQKLSRKIAATFAKGEEHCLSSKIAKHWHWTSKLRTSMAPGFDVKNSEQLFR